MFIIRLLAFAALAGYGWLLLKTFKTFPRPNGGRRQVPLATLRDTFPGYSVAEAEFFIDDQQMLWRINSDGSAHLVHAPTNAQINHKMRWVFNKNNGEFNPITFSNARGNIINVKDTFRNREVEYIRFSPGAKRIGAAFFVLLGLWGVACFYAIFFGADPEAGVAAGALILGSLLLWLGYLGIVQFWALGGEMQKRLALGPEPLKAAEHDHGPPVTSGPPSAPTSPQAPADDLSYRPNA